MSIDDKMQEISEELDFLEGLEKVEYVVDMAKKAASFPDSEKSDSNKVYGCMSETWIIVEKDADTVHIKFDSEAQIVKGMLYLLGQSINGHSKEEILALDEQNVLNKLGLGGSITNRRMNGFASAILKIKEDIHNI